jgi:hypothetical protein
MTFNIFLAVRFVHRSHRAALPDIPTAAEYVPGYEASGCSGVGVPKKTRAEITTSSTKRSMQPLAIPR